MGLLDTVIGALSQPQAGSGSRGDLLGALIGMLGQGQQGGGLGGMGGLGGLIAKMQQSGLGDVAGSWVGTGQNQPIAPDQLGGVLGQDRVSEMASQLGMGQGDLLSQLSQMLPQVVDKLTPQGQVPQGDIGSILSGMLGGGGAGLGAGTGADHAGGQPDLGALAGMLGGMLNKR